MLKGVYQNPFIAILLSSFDLLQGVQLLEKWTYSDISISFEDLIKIVLSNVHRQNEDVYYDIVTSSIDILCVSLRMINSIFCIPQKGNTIFYSMTLLMSITDCDEPYVLIDKIYPFLIDLAKLARCVILTQQQISKLNPYVSSAFQSFKTLYQNFKKVDLPFAIRSSDSMFLSKVFSSHLEAQMHTIFEVTSESDAEFFISFLSVFHPHKLLISTDIRDFPTSGLMIQCVKKQSMSPYEILLNFHTPCSYVQLCEQKVYQSPSLNFHLTNHSDYIELLLNADYESRKKLSVVTSNYQKLVKIINAAAPFAVYTVSLVIQTPSNLRFHMCQLQSSSLMRKVLNLNQLVNETLSYYKIDYLNQDHVLELTNSLDISCNDDFSIILSIASISNPDILNKFVLNPKKP